MLNHLKTINNYSKVFLIVFLVIALLPIHKLTGSNIQSIFIDGILHYSNYNKPIKVISHTLFTLLCISAYYTNDGVLFGLLLFFYFFDSDVNKDKKDKGRWYV